MQLYTLLHYPVSRLHKMSLDQFAIVFSSAISYLSHQKDLLATEKNADVRAHYRKKVTELEATLVTLRMHEHYQAYQNEVASMNLKHNRQHEYLR